MLCPHCGKDLNVNGVLPLRDREFKVPRLRVGPYERAMTLIAEADKIDAATDPFGLAKLNASCAAIAELLKETHPEATIAELKDLIPLGDLDAVLARLLDTGGKTAGEARSP